MSSELTAEALEKLRQYPQKLEMQRYASGETLPTVPSPGNSYEASSGDESDSENYVSDDDSGSEEEEDDYVMEDEQTFLAKRRDSMISLSEAASSAGYSESDCSESDYTEGSDMEGSGHGSSSVYTSEDYSEWSSDEDDGSEYDDLMATLPIALGRKGPAAAGPAMPRSFSSLKSAASQAPEGLPIPLSTSAGDVPELTDPMEGLAMFQNIRSELEQVGRMIVAKKDGEKFLQRAHILASINWLSSNVPSCVLDHLGKEIRGTLAKSTSAEPAAAKNAYDELVSTLDVNEDDSDASDLSDADMSVSDDEFCSDGQFDGSGPEPTFAPPRRTRSTDAQMSDGAPALGRQSSLLRIKSMEVIDNAPTLSHVAQSRQSRRGSMVSQSTMESEPTHTQRESHGPVPFVAHFQCALLFVDISGFTKLATLLDPENLSKVINSYFQQIVDKVFEYQGDIQKFAGDALFAEWRVSDSCSLAQCVEAATACASSLIKDCADFPVMAFGGTVGQGKAITHLNVHCGLGVGEMAGIHIGDSELRREYVYVGDPIQQATHACTKASLGEVVASRKVYNVLSFSGMLENSFVTKQDDFITIADGDVERLKSKQLKLGSFGVRNAKSRGITDHVDGLEVEALIEYRRLMSLYVHPVVVSNDVAAGDGFRSSGVTASAQERHREEAELRDVYVLFIKPLVSTDLSGDYKKSAQGLNDIMTLTTRELERYNGHLRQFIMDDKGLVLIATFGLRGSTFPNLVAERALPATVIIHNALQMELGVESRIGATFGDAYCGPVGGVHRHEYAVMGPAVNLAARLMDSPENPGLLVDNAVRRLAAQSYSFNALTPVRAKGYKDLVPIFEPLTALERPWGKIVPTFVGRRDEIVSLMEKAKHMASTKGCAPSLVLISSSAGMGKSTMLVHTIEHIRKMFGPRAAGCLVSKNVGKESDAHIPFRTIRPMMLKLLQHFEEEDESRSCVSGTNSSSVDAMVAFDNVSVGSQSTCLDPSVAQATDGLTRIRDILKAKAGVVDRVRAFVLEEASTGALRILRNKPEMVEEMATFISRTFRLCTRGRTLTLIALDDVHHADEASWLVLQKIFETGDNVLMVGTAFSTADNTFRMEPSFWSELNEMYSKNGRFQTMELGGLSKDDLEAMTMKTLGLQRHEIPPETLKEVVVQSGGMPRFASKILDGIKDRIASEHVVQVDDSIAEIILHRIDSFDLPIRNTLNVGAVLGESFTVADVIAVMKESSDTKEDDLRRQVADSLKKSLADGILEIAGAPDFVDAEAACEKDETCFFFHHKVWRLTLLGLMLDSRKRDVHRKIATSMSQLLEQDSSSLAFKTKLFSHWKATGDTKEAAKTALMAGEGVSEEAATKDVLQLYVHALQMWGWDKHVEGHVAGFSSEVLDFVDAGDLGNILRLMIAQGRTLYSNEEHKESISSFEDALRIFQVAKTAANLKDRSVIFPAFVGLSHAISDGHIHQDVRCRYEASMLRRFLEDTRIHGRLIHHIYALYLQMVFYSRQNELEKAIAVQSIIKKLYKPDKHSESLRKIYGVDAGALSFSLAAYYEMTKGDSRQALRSCRHVLKELLTRVKNDFDQALSTMYPLVLVLKESGFSGEARAFFEKVVVEPFTEKEECLGSFPLMSVFEALSILFALTGKQKVKESKLAEYIAWATKRENLLFDEKVNLRLGRLGRCANTISAEICLQVAGQVPDGSEKDILLEYGRQLVVHATLFHRKNGLAVARKQAQSLSAKFRMVGDGSNRFEYGKHVNL